MPHKDFHMMFRDVASISLLVAAFENSFPLFLSQAPLPVVNPGGKLEEEKVFQILKAFSTSFPQMAVDAEGQ
jgi:hypothetical protein